MLGWLVLIFVSVPVVELGLLIWIGQKIDVLPTIALVIGTGILGAALTRYQGLRVLGRYQAELAAGRLPHREILDGILILIAGAVLITPGILTDCVGFLLLVPAVRAAVRKWIVTRLRSRVTVVGDAPRDPRVIDAEFTVKEDSPGDQNAHNR